MAVTEKYINLYDLRRSYEAKDVTKGLLDSLRMKSESSSWGSGVTSAFFVGESHDRLIVADGQNSVSIWMRDSDGKWRNQEVYRGEYPIIFAEPDSKGDHLILTERTGEAHGAIRSFSYSISAKQRWHELGDLYGWWFMSAFDKNSNIFVADGKVWRNVYTFPTFEDLKMLAEKELTDLCHPKARGDYRSSQCWPARYQ